MKFWVLQIVKFWKFANFWNWTILKIWLFYELVNLGKFPLQYEIKFEKLERRNSFISKNKYENWQNCDKCGISNGRTIPKLPIFGAKLWFLNWKKSRNFSIFQFGKLKKISIWNLGNFKNVQCGKFKKIHFGN